MDIDVENVDKNDKNTWRNIYDAIYAPYHVEIKPSLETILDQCKKYPNKPKNITTEIKNKTKKISLEAILYVQVVMVYWKRMVPKKNGENHWKFLL